jgi:hypothetical protein
MALHDRLTLPISMGNNSFLIDTWIIILILLMNGENSFFSNNKMASKFKAY